MGYRREAKVYRLVFADPEYDGLIVRAKSVPLGDFLRITELAEAAQGGAVSVEGVRELFATFAAALVDWNLEDEDGAPVPATVEGMLTQDLPFVLAIVMEWMQATAGVAPPLPGDSNGGETFPEESIPMVPLSPVRAS